MSSEALRLADRLPKVLALGDTETPMQAAALLREQAIARALDTFAHNVLAGQARLQMVHLENKLQNVIAERDTLRAEVERLRKPLTDEQILDAFCVTPNIHQFISAFKAGARFAESHYKIGGDHADQA